MYIHADLAILVASWTHGCHGKVLGCVGGIINALV